MEEPFRVIRLLHQVLIAFCGTIIALGIARDPQTSYSEALTELEALKAVQWDTYQKFAENEIKENSLDIFGPHADLRRTIHHLYSEAGVNRPLPETKGTIEIPGIFKTVTVPSSLSTLKEIKDFLDRGHSVVAWFPNTADLQPKSKPSLPPQVADAKLSVSMGRRSPEKYLEGIDLVPSSSAVIPPVTLTIFHRLPYAIKAQQWAEDLVFPAVRLEQKEFSGPSGYDWLEESQPTVARIVGIRPPVTQLDPKHLEDVFRFPELLPKLSTPSVWIEVVEDTVPQAILKIKARAASKKRTFGLLGMEFEKESGVWAAPLLTLFLIGFIAVHLHSVAQCDWPAKFDRTTLSLVWLGVSRSKVCVGVTLSTLLLLPIVANAFFIEKMSGPALRVWPGHVVIVLMLVPILFVITYIHRIHRRIDFTLGHLVSTSIAAGVIP